MEKTGTQLNLRSRIIAMLLAALMVVGMAFMALPSTVAHATTPTGNEWIDNPFSDNSVPQGGEYRFVGEEFVPETTILVFYVSHSDSGLLGTFDIGANGKILPTVSDEPYPGAIIPSELAPGSYDLYVYYADDFTLIPSATVEIDVLANPYSAEVWIQYDASNGERLIRFRNLTSGAFAPNQDIYMKIDYMDEPTYGPLTTSATGIIDGGIYLPDGLAGTGVHSFTFLTGTSGNYPKMSITYNLTL